LSNEKKEQAKAFVEQLNDAELRGVNWDALATKVGMAVLYNTVYRFTSGEAAHATLLALNRHVRSTAEGEFDRFVFQHDALDIEQTLSMAICSLLNVMEQMNLVVPIGDAIAVYMKRWDALVTLSSVVR
jgi:Family of unknown function (DUF5677)